jgi:hypothetical protein
VLLLSGRELAVAGYPGSNRATTAAPCHQGGNRRDCDNHGGGPGKAGAPSSEGEGDFRGGGQVLSAWSTSATGRRAPMLVGTAVSTAMTTSVRTTIATSDEAEGSVVVPPPFFAAS